MVVFALTLIRHGETAHNKDNVIQGQMDVPLSQTGLRQAELLGLHLQYQQYTHTYTSDLKRAVQTAESIIRQNKSSRSILVHDCQLRERKFGIFEGKSFKILREAAEKSRQNAGQYTPPGGETIQQVHERAVSFFNGLCETVKLESQNDCAEASTNGSHLENGKQSGQKGEWEFNEAEEVKKNDYQNGCHSKICVKDFQEADDSESSDSQTSFNGDENPNSANISDVPVDSEKMCCHEESEVDCLKQVNSSSSAKLFSLADRRQFSITFADDIIRSQIMSSRSDLPNIECPNVSLSPLVDQNFVTSSLLPRSLQESAHTDTQHERRLSVCSSCDDADSGPTLIANVLVVSHGGWLRELLRYFVEDLECSVPGGKKQALRISPNAGLSKFTVSLEEGSYPKIICLQIHDKQHLSTTSYADNMLNPNEIAL